MTGEERKNMVKYFNSAIHELYDKLPHFEEVWYDDDEPEKHCVFDYDDEEVEYDDFEDLKPQKETMVVNVLGTLYTIEFRALNEDSILKNNNIDGYCDSFNKLIVISDPQLVRFKGEEQERQLKLRNHIIRHEIIHAFLHESGLKYETWAENETMVNWIADMLEKMALEINDLKVW